MLRSTRLLLNAAFGLNFLLLFFLLVEGKLSGVNNWLQVFGRMHPMILHFPIALLVLVLVIEFIKKNGHSEDLIELLLAVTAFSAAVAAIMGLLLFHTGGYESSSVSDWHKWTGVAVSILSYILTWLRPKQNPAYKFLLPLGVILIIIAGHNGASMTHGENFVLAPLQSKDRKDIDLEKAIVYTDIIHPIMEDKCISCHNPNKSKGDLQLITPATILKGGENGPPVVPGSPDSSILYQYLLLPMKDDKHMPPEGKPQLDKEEIALLHWWIQSGAKFDELYTQADLPDTIKTIIEKRFLPASPLDNLAIGFPDPSELGKLNTLYRGVRQLSADKPYVHVFLANRKDLTEKDLKELKPIRDQIISIDVSNSNLNDKLGAEILSFPHLQKLHFENTVISDTLVSKLSALKFLEYLNLSKTRVSVEGVRTALSIPGLKKLFVYETNIPMPDLNTISKQVANLEFGYSPDLSADSSFKGRLAIPTVKVDSNLFTRFATVTMSYRLKGVDLRYTLDGSEPDSNSEKYTAPIQIRNSRQLKVIASRTGWESSPVQQFDFIHAPNKFVSARLAVKPDKRYEGKLDTTIVDLVKGSDSHADGNYIGYEGNGMEATLDLGELKNLSELSVGYVRNHGAYVLSPSELVVWAGTDGNNYKKLGSARYSETKFIPGSKQGSLKVEFPEKQYRYFKVKVSNPGKTPSWHPNAGAKCWIFIDEVMVK